jgi:hypothetical protein
MPVHATGAASRTLAGMAAGASVVVVGGRKEVEGDRAAVTSW